MKQNVGNIDRVVRILVAVVFAVLYFTHSVEGTLGLVLLILGAVFALTALVGFCPLYLPFGISTCKTKK
ncbi:MAG: DUF2892 domain-containing protein [Flavobacteriales bacterium]|nr:DUF2892 domain-containing protein [Flavobacteriales bacterium]